MVGALGSKLDFDVYFQDSIFSGLILQFGG